MSEIILPFTLCVLVAVIGYKLKSLTFSGGIATIFVGLSVAIGFGYGGLMLLGAFFASSSLWSKYKSDFKEKHLSGKIEKGEQRDSVQVIANGGVPAILGIAMAIFPSPTMLSAFIASIAAANADTWASEIGSISKKRPYLITSFKQVDPGTSGAVSNLGTIAALFGSIFICFLSYLYWDLSIYIIIFLVFVGFAGNIMDTILGAIVQVGFKCTICNIETEKTIHCKNKTVHHKGFLAINNDLVNFLSILFSAISAGLISILLIR
ncbi:DUF92 domain-containing protein [Cytobacillus suaedae]|nr:DUF92 domain-containing protein [Cytobacillus suaedae]